MLSGASLSAAALEDAAEICVFRRASNTDDYESGHPPSTGLAPAHDTRGTPERQHRASPRVPTRGAERRLVAGGGLLQWRRGGPGDARGRDHLLRQAPDGVCGQRSTGLWTMMDALDLYRVARAGHRGGRIHRLSPGGAAPARRRAGHGRRFVRGLLPARAQGGEPHRRPGRPSLHVRRGGHPHAGDADVRRRRDPPRGARARRALVSIIWRPRLGSAQAGVRASASTRRTTSWVPNSFSRRAASPQSRG